MATKKKSLPKAQIGTASTDSTAYYKKLQQQYKQLSNSEKGNTEVSKFNKKWFQDKSNSVSTDILRQYHKGSPGYDKNGNPIKKKGGSIKSKSKNK
jgi:hypothetical protein